jgi:serine/threonine protein kinase
MSLSSMSYFEEALPEIDSSSFLLSTAVMAIQAKKKHVKGKIPPSLRPKKEYKDGKSSSYYDSSPEYSDYSDGESSEEEQEDPRDYRPGGYHLVQIGDMYNSRYVIQRKLGWGHFSTVWLSWDIRNKRHVALKVVKSAQHYTETARDEIDLLKKVANGDKSSEGKLKVVQLLDDFKIHGPNGTHICMVFEVLGNNLLKLIIQSDYKGLPLHAVKWITKQVLMGLDYLHTQCQIIHTDIKPENILLCVSDEYVKKLADEGANSKSAVSSAPTARKLLTSTVSHGDPLNMTNLTKNQKKRLKKKIKKQKQKEEVNNVQQKEEDVSKLENSTEKDDSSDKKPSLPAVGKPVVNGSNSSSSSMDISSTVVSTEAQATVQETTSDSRRDKSADERWGALGGPIDVKIADLGNACWIDHHFTDQIQTRQYRCLEVILGAEYGPPADIWSLACMVFELATGDYLFEPKAGRDYSRDEDHIAHIIELLGNIPKNLIKGQYAREFFTKKGLSKLCGTMCLV